MLEAFGEKCLVILDGLDEHAPGGNADVFKMIRGQKYLKCNLMVSSRPHSTKGLEQHFQTVVRVNGFTLSEARKFALKILQDKSKVENILTFNPSDFRQEMELYNYPILLSFLCLLVREDDIDLSHREMPVGEIYTRMVRCLYKKYTLRKNKDYVDEEFVSVLKSVGSLALDTLLSGNPLMKRSEVLKKVGSEAFDYGLLIGHEDFRLIRDETADIFVAFPHRSLQEFAGSFYFVLMLSEGATLDSLLGEASESPIFMMNPLFLQFSVWFLYKSHNYFNISDRLVVCNVLQNESLRHLRSFQLLLPDIVKQFPAINVELACKNNDVLLLQYFSKILSQLSNVTLLEMTSPVTFDWILTSLSPTLDTVKYTAIEDMIALTCYHDNELLVTIDEPLKPDLLEKTLCNCK